MSPPRTKTRLMTTPFEVPSAGFKVTNPTLSPPVVNHAAVSGWKVHGTQTTVSEGHLRPKGKSRLADGDIGGNFFTTKQYIEGVQKPVSFMYSRSLPIQTDFVGTVQWYPVAPSAALFPPSAHSSNDALDELGATAISRCKPTKTTASFAVTLGELRKEGLPKLVGAPFWESKTRELRNLKKVNPGSEYLNVEFGWNPLLRDIRSFAGGVMDADRLASQYIRDEGRPVRRDYRFPTEITTNDPVHWGVNQEHISPFNSRFMVDMPQNTYYVDTITKTCWFEGVFSYAIPPTTKKLLGEHVAAAAQVLGVVPDPDTLWNLAPWSWAVDWFSNAGDVVSNASDWATDGLVMRYGYVMERSIIKRTFYSVGSRFGPGGGSVAPDISFITETKVRRRANPFGFGLNWDGLSPRQLAIAAALGISRAL